MKVTKEDIDIRDLILARVLRTESTEKYNIFTKHGSLGEQLELESGLGNRIGFLNINFIAGPNTLRNIQGELVIEDNNEWTEEAAIELIEYIVTLIGTEGNHIPIQNQDFEVIFADERRMSIDLNYSPTLFMDLILDSISENHDKIAELDESVTELIENSVEDNFNDIKEIIEAEGLDDDAKKQKLANKMKVGLERGLPTILYETSVSNQNSESD